MALTRALAALAVAALLLGGCLGFGAPPAPPTPQEQIAGELGNVSAALNEAAAIAEPSLVEEEFPTPI
ncbi:MAG: hypothetical protein QXG98_02120 [Candidatus Micrarchaeia archaeon]